MVISSKRTFQGGLHIPDNKQLSMDKSIDKMPTSDKVFISLSQHIGKPAKAVVAVGDKVQKGTLIGQADGGFSANIYSSVSGEVVEIKDITNHLGKQTYIVIKNDGQESEVRFADIDKTDGAQIVNRIMEAGIVGLGGAGFPTAVKITPKETIDTVLINGAECEPYLTCDYRLLIERTADFIEGTKYLSTALNGARVIVGIEDNKPKAIELLKNDQNITVVPLKKKYPQGSEKQLIYACTGRKVGLGKLPASTGVCVFNVQTAIATYEAVANNKPLYERVMTVTGRGIVSPCNLLVRNGTPYQEIIDFCGGLNDSARKIIAGGPMMGKALTSLDVYTRKTDSGLLVLAKKEANELEPTACINCASCANACPMKLMPMYFDLYTNLGQYEKAKEYGVMNCFECGTCAYVCPAKRDLVGSIQLCKKKLKEMK